MRRAASTPLNMILAVVVTCTISASALSLTYALTRDRIVAQQKAAEERALREVLPEAREFERLEAEVVSDAGEATGETPVSAVYRADDADGQVVGWAVRCSPRGYGGPIQMIVGLDRKGKVTGASVITHNETPGLGTKVLDDPTFMTQFAQWEAMQITRDSKTFDGISGATKSAVGIRKGVVAAAQAYAAVLVDYEGAEGGDVQ